MKERVEWCKGSVRRGCERGLESIDKKLGHSIDCLFRRCVLEVDSADVGRLYKTADLRTGSDFLCGVEVES